MTITVTLPDELGRAFGEAARRRFALPGTVDGKTPLDAAGAAQLGLVAMIQTTVLEEERRRTWADAHNQAALTVDAMSEGISVGIA